MMAAPFAAFAVGLGLAMAGRERGAVWTLGAALALSAAVFAWHLSDPLAIGL